MIKKERFVIIAKVRQLTGEMDEVAVGYSDIYPDDNHLEALWFESTQRVAFNKVYYLKVEKQVRFE